MKANLITKTIEMSKNEAKAAGRIGTEKFNELREYQRAYPNYTICIIEAPKKKSQYSGLNYKFMETYIYSKETPSTYWLHRLKHSCSNLVLDAFGLLHTNHHNFQKPQNNLRLSRKAQLQCTKLPTQYQ